MRVVAGRAGDPHGALRPVAPAARREIGDRPDQEGAEQEKIGERAVGEEMREGPDLDRENHGVAEPRLDPTRRHDEGGEQDEGRPGSATIARCFVQIGGDQSTTGSSRDRP